MHIKKNFTKFLSSISKKTATITTTLTILVVSAMVTANASVDFSGGVRQVTNSVTSQGKTIAGIVFGAVAVFALAFTIAKGIKATLAYRRGEDVHLGPVIAGGIGTVVAGLASASTFFGTFGL